MIGRVVSNKMNKSAVVLIETKKRHALYGKIFNRSKRFLVDDPLGVTEGDVVEIIKIRPISKNKHFQIKKVLGKDLVALGEEALKIEAKEAIEQVLPEEKKESEQGTGGSEEKKLVMSKAHVDVVKEEKTKKGRKKKGEASA